MDFFPINNPQIPHGKTPSRQERSAVIKLCAILCVLSDTVNHQMAVFNLSFWQTVPLAVSGICPLGLFAEIKYSTPPFGS
jgi:hypothetical protein